jgi:hypothetical protein
VRIISQELRAWEREEYSDLRDSDLEDMRCWFCGEQVEDAGYAETIVDVDGMLMWVPACDNCDPPQPPPTPIAARLACPICSETLAPPRRHSCGGAADGQMHIGVASLAVSATATVTASI